MKLHFLFPANPLDATSVDEMFADQVKSLRATGLSVSVCPDSVIQSGRRLRNIPAGATIVYRGWMLTGEEYERLAEAIGAESAVPLTSPESYLATHHLPNWYPLIREFTPETHVVRTTANLERELRLLKWDAFFIKDYVKSLKTSRGSIIRDPAEVESMAAEMRRIRGEIEGGFCIRRVEPFIPESERRYFVLCGKVFSATEGRAPDMLETTARRIPSKFFTVDVIQREDGVWRVVEIGDGQVSDLVGWSAERFAEIWKGML